MSNVFNTNVQSELSEHKKKYGGEASDRHKNEWIFSHPDESVTSFLRRCTPSQYLGDAEWIPRWISTNHKGRQNLVSRYYSSQKVSHFHPDFQRFQLNHIGCCWEKEKTKSMDKLIQIVQKFDYGCGKWMIFVNRSEIDRIWKTIVTALWDGKLGHSAKVNTHDTDHSTHLICVYVDPFWNKKEMERVLKALRKECCITAQIKFKADAVTLLNIYKDNPWHIPSSFYVSEESSYNYKLNKPKPYKPRPCIFFQTRDGCRRGEKCTYLHILPELHDEVGEKLRF